ncbi:ComF family protein [Candidatus Oleimmundimicrobium sp.]|uniref:ComF family protein n=1 Tax=Candidatus Oleimmundimicrobium sp. TaxID=3060597 RepID=UPI0027269A35|nr:ComF family protein [Candidatus Oleimmundimicrobium sp.]MDO8886576.1 ComF family protein [Candidatus Oleimmundimicrobium sp.]
MKDTFKGFLDLFYPARCRACGAFSKNLLCPDCLDSFSLIQPPICKRCGKPCSMEVDDCRECKNKFKFSVARSLGLYEGNLRTAIHKFKYKNARGLAATFAEMMTGLANDFNNVDLITNVPLSRKKELYRGYNQAHLLAQEIAKRTDLICEATLRRVAEEVDQTKLSLKERKQNVKGAFVFNGNKNITGKSLLLIDDVFTTGSTVNECGKVLLKAGAKNLSVLTIARVCDI